MPETVSPRRQDADDSPFDQPSPEEVLALLGDELARAVLQHVAQEPLPARVLADRLGVARSTVYSRLDRLEAAGLVEGSMHYHPDGHHRRRFDTRLDEFRVSLEDGELTVDIAAASQAL